MEWEHRVGLDLWHHLSLRITQWCSSDKETTERVGFQSRARTLRWRLACWQQTQSFGRSLLSPALKSPLTWPPMKLRSRIAGSGRSLKRREISGLGEHPFLYLFYAFRVCWLYQVWGLRVEGFHPKNANPGKHFREHQGTWPYGHVSVLPPLARRAACASCAEITWIGELKREAFWYWMFSATKLSREAQPSRFCHHILSGLLSSSFVFCSMGLPEGVWKRQCWCRFAKTGLWGGLVNAALEGYIFRGRAPWTLRHRYTQSCTFQPF